VQVIWLVPGGQMAATTGVLAREKGVEVRSYGFAGWLNGVTSRVPREVLTIKFGFNAFLTRLSLTGQLVGEKVWPPLTSRWKFVVVLVISADVLSWVVGEKIGCGSVADGQVTVDRTAGVQSVVVPSQFARR
jgi:hypothetical protein